MWIFHKIVSLRNVSFWAYCQRSRAHRLVTVVFEFVGWLGCTPIKYNSKPCSLPVEIYLERVCECTTSKNIYKTEIN